MSEKPDAIASSATDVSGITSNGPKATIKNVDMTEDMQQEAVDITSAALEKYNIEKDIAAQIKKEFDRRHGPTWHVVVGKNFGSYVTHGQLPQLSLPARGDFSALGLRSSYHYRNQALHLLLCRLACHSHLEVIGDSRPSPHSGRDGDSEGVYVHGHAPIGRIAIVYEFACKHFAFPLYLKFLAVLDWSLCEPYGVYAEPCTHDLWPARTVRDAATLIDRPGHT
jgi:dynein light chain LC8-type